MPSYGVVHGEAKFEKEATTTVVYPGSLKSGFGCQQIMVGDETVKINRTRPKVYSSTRDNDYLIHKIHVSFP